MRGVPFTYISTQDVANDADLRAKYDVILFPPVGRAAGQAIINGHADVRQSDAVEDDGADAEPRQRWTQTDDIRPGWAGRAWPTCRSSCARAAC